MRRQPGSMRLRAGVTLPEVLVTALILAFVVAATAGLYTIGQAQQQTARGYSRAQTDIRSALNRITRTLRHGYRIVDTSSVGALAGMSSGATQAIVEVPEPGAASTAQVRFYRAADGTVYFQRHTDAAPGTALIRGVQALTFQYLQTTDPGTGLATFPAPTPGQATEVRITITANRPHAVTTVQAYVTLRNALGGSF